MKRWRSIISLLLALVFVLQLLPMSSFAVESAIPENAEDRSAVKLEDEPIANTPALVLEDAAPYIVGEIESRREEAVKHFRMSDGSFAMVQFPEPIHWKDSAGKWQDIDNTLVEHDGRYVAENGSVTKSFASSMADGELCRITYGRYSVGMTYVIPVTAGKPVQPDLPAASKDTPAQEIQAADAPTPEETQGAFVQDTASTVTGVDTPIEGTQYAIHRDTTVQANIENSPSKVLSNLSVTNALKQEIAPSKVQYTNADNNIDLVYENQGYNTKESIIIHERQPQYMYTFALDCTGLTPKIQDNGSILLQTDKDKAIFEIPAPILEDANGIVSDAASYSLNEENGHWILTVEAEAKWMNSDERAFPVQLDPSIIVRYGSNTVYSSDVRSFIPDMAGTDHEMLCGFNDSAGECRVALQITNLPQIPSDSTPVSVQVALFHAAYYNSSSIGSTAPTTPMLIEVHEITDGVTSVGTQTWNTLVSKVDSKVIDYQKVSRETRNTYVNWDITSAGLQWYANNDTNRGLIFIAPNAQAEHQTANISGSFFVSLGPVLIVSYLSAVGIEDRFSFQQVGADRAGDVSINDFTQQMTVTHTDLVFNSEVMPFTLSHVYNSERANQQFSSSAGINTRDFTAMVVGAGWKLSAQQTVISKVIGDTTYLIYNDEDGTDHYFQKTAYNTYEDEEGLNLKIVVAGSTYTMTGEDANNTWTFYNGYLISQKDLVGNMIYFAYNSQYNPSNTAWKPTNGSNNQLVQIVSVPVGHSPTTICTFEYTGWFLTSMTDYANRTTTFSVQGENGRNILKYIQHPDSTLARYEYEANSGWLQQLYDTESKYGLEINNRTCQGTLTVNRVREFTAPSANGNKAYGNAFHAYRNSASLTSYRFYGADHTYDSDNSGDDIVFYSVFDHSGKTICSYETDSGKDVLLGVEAASFTKNSGTSKQNNRLTSASSLGLQVENILNDVGAETEAEYSRWHPANASGEVAIAQHEYSPDTARTGKGSLHCKLTNGATASQTVSFYQDVNLKQGETYVFSGYINTSFAASHPLNTGAYLQIATTSNNQIHKSDIINYTTYTSHSGDGIDNFDSGWEKVSVTFTPTSTTNYRLSFVLCGVEGDAFADDFQLERRAATSVQDESIGASSTNLVTFGSFDGSFPEYTYNWTGSDFSTASSDFLLGRYCAKTIGDTGAQHRLSQTIPIYRNSSDLTFVLSGWGKADSIASAVAEPSSACLRYFGLIATIHYEGGNTEDHYVSFSPSYSGWQYASGNIVPKLADTVVQSITVSCAYDYNANTAKFDNISLVREPVQTYTYDSEGNLISAVDGNAKNSINYIPGTHRPQTYTTPSGITHTFTYNSNNQLATETVSDVVTSNTYDTTGNLTTQTIRDSNNTVHLQSSRAYSSDAHFLIYAEDTNGVTASRTFDGSRNLLTSQSGSNAIQQYGYFANSDRVQQTFISGKASLTYSYNNGVLSSLQRKSFNGSTAFYQRYNIPTDAFGNKTSVDVCGSTNGSTFSAPITLSSYTYESGVNNGRCTSMTYPNGDAVTYSYDLFDRVIAENYTGTVASTNAITYDGEGNIAEKTETRDGHTERYSYQYDGLGRLFHSRAYINGAQTLATTHYYDTSNRLKRQDWVIGTNGFSQQLNYSESDGTLTSFSSSADVAAAHGTSSPTATITYNALRQPVRRTILTGNSVFFYRAFSYRTIGGSRSSSQIEYMNYRRSDDSLILGFKYGYDNSGRIASVTPTTGTGTPDTSKAVTYSYDSMGQITGCIDNSSGSTVNYSYTIDTAGNIRKAIKGSTAISYAYENPSWPDLLTKVTIGGIAQSIDYTTPGLPDNWYNGNEYELSWKHGSQLATANKDHIETSYSYDMEGIRSDKTVGGTAYHFDTLGGKVVHQIGAARELWFIYDENGQPYMMITQAGNTIEEYYYLLNQQGDVVGLTNRFRVLVAKYSYDPYGAPTATWIHPGDGAGALNPLRYRGYFYDFETGFYYLQSRYYDPVIGRFISADTFATTDANGFLSCNMFAYCENDPVNREDPSGTCGIAAIALVTLTSVAVGFVVGAASQMASNFFYGKPIGKGVLEAGIGGAAYNATMVLTGGNFIAAGYTSAFFESASKEVFSYIRHEKTLTKENVTESVLQVSWDTAVNGTFYAATGKLANKRAPTRSERLTRVSFTANDFRKLIKNTIYQSGAYHFGRFVLNCLKS